MPRWRGFTTASLIAIGAETASRLLLALSGPVTDETMSKWASFSADNGVRADLSHLFLKMPMTRKRFGNSLPLRYLLSIMPR